MTGPAAAAALHPPPHQRPQGEVDEQKSRREEARLQGQGQVVEDVDPYDLSTLAHPEHDSARLLAAPGLAVVAVVGAAPVFWPFFFGAWGVAAGVSYAGHRLNPDNQTWRNAQLRTLHPFHSHWAKKAGRREYLNDNHASIWKSQKARTDAKIKAKMGDSTSKWKLAWVMNYEYNWLILQKRCSFFWLYDSIELARKTATILKNPFAYWKAGHDKRSEFASKFYGDATVEADPVRPGSLYRRVGAVLKDAARTESLFSQAFGVLKDAVTGVVPPVPQDQSESLGDPSQEAEVREAFERAMADHEPDASGVAAARATAEAPTAEQEGTAPPDPTSPMPSAPQAGQPPWEFLDPHLGLTPIERALVAQAIVAREAITSALADVLQQVSNLADTADPAEAQQLTMDYIEADRIGGHRNAGTLTEADVQTRELLDSVIQIATAEKGTGLSKMKELARATLEGKRNRPQIGTPLAKTGNLDLAKVREQIVSRVRGPIA